MTAKAIKDRVTVGSMWRITNHYITRRDHACYGTRLAMVTAKTGASVTFGERDYMKWPKASQIQQRNNGAILLYGGGCAQGPDDLWLTLEPLS